MQPDRRDAAFIFDMLEAASNVSGYLKGKTWDDFQNGDMLRSAVERKIEIIGEAARRISKSFTSAHPQIPWSKIITTRHVLAHDYDAVNRMTVWKIATHHVPELIEQLTLLLPEAPPDPRPEE